MARIRTIKPQFFTSEDVTALDPLARLLFVGLFTECDRDGRVEDRPKTLKMRLLPGDDVDVDALLWNLVDGGLIRRYEAADNVRVIQVCAFAKHQKPHPKEADSILLADGRNREKPHLNTASREQVSILPVENPSCPQSSLREGVSDPLREGVVDNAKPQRTQGQGAFTPGSLPRDHMFHAVCGPRRRLCLSQTVYGGFARRYGGDEVAARVALTTWVEALEREVGDGAIGDHLWLTKHFDVFLHSIGRAPVAPEKPGQKRVRTPEEIKRSMGLIQ